MRAHCSFAFRDAATWSWRCFNHDGLLRPQVHTRHHAPDAPATYLFDATHIWHQELVKGDLHGRPSILS